MSNDLRFIGFGSCGEVGRSAFVLEDNENKILLEAGLKLIPFQPSVPPLGLDEYASELDAAIISHAHVDHSGYLPAVYRHGFKGKAYMTDPSLEICRLLWEDHFKIEGERYWTMEDLETVYEHVVTMEYRKKRKITEDISVEFFNAGHILGSAMTLIDWKGYRILYTGDFNDNQTPFFDGYDMPDDPVDLVITESTNGVRTVPSREKINNAFTKEVTTVLKQGKKVLIPSFAVGRSQELLTVLTDTIHEYPIYVDGMINRMNAITERYLTPKWVSPEFLAKMKERGVSSPFEAENVVGITRENFERTWDFRRHIGQVDEPFIIISTSGMLMPSPIHTHMRYNADDPQNLLAFVGYQAEGTIGRDIIEGSRQVSVQLDRKTTTDVPIRSRVMQFHFSGHVSEEGIRRMFEQMKPKEVIFVHGTEDSRKSVATLLDKETRVHFPQIGEEIKIGSYEKRLNA